MLLAEIPEGHEACVTAEKADLARGRKQIVAGDDGNSDRGMRRRADKRDDHGEDEECRVGEHPVLHPWVKHNL